MNLFSIRNNADTFYEVTIVPRRNKHQRFSILCEYINNIVLDLPYLERKRIRCSLGSMGKQEKVTVPESQI